MKKLTYGLLALCALTGVLMLTPLGATAQQTIRNITISAMPADATELPAAAALGDNTANPTVPGVASFSMCWDGATWDRCSGTSADTELSAAAAASDNFANPTTAGVLSFNMCWDGATWDRCAPDPAHDAADSGNPLKIGGKAESSLSGVTLVADGDRTDAYLGLDGVLITRPHANLEDIVQERTTNTDGASTGFASGLAAPGAGIRIYLTSCTISNSSASFATIDIRDGTAGTVLWTFPLPATGGVTHNFTLPLKFTANTAVAFDASAATSTIAIACNGFKSKV